MIFASNFFSKFSNFLKVKVLFTVKVNSETFEGCKAVCANSFILNQSFKFFEGLLKLVKSYILCVVRRNCFKSILKI